MVRLIGFALPLALFLLAGPARAAEYYVAPTGGSDSGACSMAAPCATVGGGQTKASAGDTVWIRGGNYSGPASGLVGVAFSKSGQSNNRIKYFAYQNEVPIFNFSNINPTNRVTGFDITASFIHIRGLEVRGVRQYRAGDDSWAVRIRGSASNNILEALNVHHNEAPGIFISDGANNLVLNCDSHHNYDVLEMGGSGDGFGCHSTNGANNTFSGCRAWYNSDDGFDFINARGGVCVVEKSWAFLNGFIPDTTTAIGNGAGFKAGGFGSPPSNYPNPVPRHVVRQCIAFGNRSQGFYANHHNGGIDFFNNLAFRNPANYNMLADSGFPSNHTIRNNIAMASGTAITQLTGGTDTFNSWTPALMVTVNSMDFLSVMESEAQAPRQPDGSLPNVNFGRLATGSDLIDKGTDVGLPFTGTAPDLGPFEVGLTAGTGGMAGTGGAGGSQGGAAGMGTGGMPGGAAGTPTGGVAGGGTGAGGAAGIGMGGTGLPTGGTGLGGAATGGVTTGGIGTGGASTSGGTGTGAVPPGGGAPAGGSGDIGDDTAEPAGCGCRVGMRHASSSALLALFLAFAAFARRRSLRR
jgi:MYXO-CTERM domain-containing protein